MFNVIHLLIANEFANEIKSKLFYILLTNLNFVFINHKNLYIQQNYYPMIRINIFKNIFSKICHKKSAQSEEIGKKIAQCEFFCENPNQAQSVKRTKRNRTK